MIRGRHLTESVTATPNWRYIFDTLTGEPGVRLPSPGDEEYVRVSTVHVVGNPDALSFDSVTTGFYTLTPVTYHVYHPT
jgi:hypothetical protein